MSQNIVELCGWNIDCVVNTLSTILVKIGKGKVPRELIQLSIFKNYTCTDNECDVIIEEIDIKETLQSSKELIKEAYEKAIRYLTSEELYRLLNFLVNEGVLGISKQIHELTNVSDDDSYSPWINELVGTLLYSDEEYEIAKKRFEKAKELYNRFNLKERSIFMEAFAKISEAEKLKRDAMKYHEEDRHDIEEDFVKKASKLYVESSLLLYKIIHTIPEASANYILSKCDAYEVLANYYFIHGMVDEAEKYYTLCLTEAKSGLLQISEEYRELIEIKKMICEGFSKLCKAIKSSNSNLYEEAADIFSKLIDKGYLEDVLIETAMIAYKGALDTATSIEDVFRVYPKYLLFAIKYVNLLIREKYDNFENLLNELKVVSLDRIAKELGIDEYTFKLYLAYKALEKSCIENNVSITTALEVLTYIAGLGLDPFTLDPNKLIEDIKSTIPDVSNEILEIILKITNGMLNYLSKWIPIY